MPTQLTTSHDANGGYTLYPSNSNQAAYLWDGSLVFLVSDGASISLFRVASPAAGSPSAASVKSFAVPGATASSIHNGDIYLVDNGNSTNDVWIGYAENNTAGGAYVQHAVYDASGTWTWDAATSCAANVAGASNQISIAWTGTYLLVGLRASGTNAFSLNYTTAKNGTSGWLTTVVQLSSISGSNSHYFGQLMHDTTLGCTVAVYSMAGDKIVGRVLPDASTPTLANWGAEVSTGAGTALSLNDFQGAAALLDHSTGQLHVAYYDGSGSGKSIGYVSGTITVNGASSSITWGTPIAVGAQSTANDSPDLAVDSSGRVYILWASGHTGSASDILYATADSPYTSVSAATNLTNASASDNNHPMTPRRARLTAGYVPVLYVSGTASPRGIQFDNTSITFSTATNLGGDQGGLSAAGVVVVPASLGGATIGGLVVTNGRYLRGVADSGPEFGNPGIAGEVYNVNWHYDSLATLQYLANRGHKLIRLPVRWERLQPTRASQGVSTLNSAELGRLTTYLSNAASLGLQVIVDLQNFCRYNTSTGTTLVMYTDFADDDLVDCWTKLSAALKGTPGLYAYELMNEPHDLPTLVGAFTSSQTVADFDTVGTTITGWTTNGGYGTGSYALSTAQAHSATHSLAYTVNSGWPGSGFADVRLKDHQNSYVYDGTHGTISVWAYIPSSNGTTFHGHIELDADIGPDFSIPANTWTQLTHTPAASSWAGNDGICVQLEVYNSVGGTPVFYMDDIQIGAKLPDTLGAQRWEASSQKVLTAIRNAGDTTLVMVDGYSWASAWRWTTSHPNGPWLTDPANNVAYTAHHYCGVNESGAFLTYAQEQADAIAAGWASFVAQAVGRLQVFTDWLRAYNVRGAVTEIAWRNDESTASWNAVGEAMYEELDAAGCDVTYWSAGEWWPFTPTYPNEYLVYVASGSVVDTAYPPSQVIEVHASTAGGTTSTPTATVTHIAGASGVVTHL